MAEEKKQSNSVGAFWKQTSRDGKKTYLSGNIQLNPPDGERIKVVVWANKNKPEGSNQPDFRMYVSQPQQKKVNEE